MPSPNAPEGGSRTAAARAFVRSLNILLRYVRLYGMGHKLTVAQFEGTWNDLQQALPAGADGFLVGASDSKLLLDGLPLASGVSERSFAELLALAGISSIFFSSKTSRDDLHRVVTAFTVTGLKRSEIAKRLKQALSDNEGAIRVNEVRYIAQDSDVVADSFSLQLTARALGGDAERVREWLSNPEKLLQLIAASQGAEKAQSTTILHAFAAGTSQPAMEEDDWNRVMRLLGQLGSAMGSEATGLSAVQQNLADTPASAQAALRQALASIAAQDPGASDPNLLMKAAEHLAIKFALERYQRGEVRVNAVREMLERMAQQLETLRKVLSAHEEKMSHAGLLVESHADILDRQFWAGVPDAAKREVLESAEAWCIPPRNIRTFVTELQARFEHEVAASILTNYAHCMRHREEDARRKVAQGLTLMADLYSACGGGLLCHTIQLAGEQLNNETVPELQALLGAALVRLAHEAGTARDFVALEQAAVWVDRIKHHRPGLGEDLAHRISFSARLPKLLEDALRSPEAPSGLIEFLTRDPASAARELATQFSRAELRDEADRIVELARRLGPPVSMCLVEVLRSRSAAEAISAIGLLSHLDLSAVREWLPHRLPQWNRAHHDETICQIAAAAAPGYGMLLTEWLDVLHPWVLPRTVDEIALSGEAAALPRLLTVAEGNLPPDAPPYLQVKAIEALPSLHPHGAVPLLRDLVESRALLGWKYPRELRVVAAQGLLRLDPAMRRMLERSGVSDSELQVSPLDPVPGGAWLRQRRYARFAPATTVRGLVTTPRGRCWLVLNLISLGGGHGMRHGRISPGTEATLELQWGLRHLESRIVVRAVGEHDLAFEITDIALEERSKLRRLLADQLRYQPAPVPQPVVGSA